jgi:hypothetical protein
MYPELLVLEARMGDHLGRTFSQRLGMPVAVAVAVHPLGCAHLTPGELQAYGRLPPGPRRRQWLTGRRALRALRVRRGEPPDTSGLEFPHRSYSLTHSGHLAVAVAVVPTDAAVGIGVDFEPPHPLDPRTARFFLTDREMRWAGSLDATRQGPELLRLWTVKEAVFKADPGNHSTFLADYFLGDPALSAGTASGPSGSGYHCRYATVAAVPAAFVGLAGMVTVACASGTAA